MMELSETLRSAAAAGERETAEEEEEREREEEEEDEEKLEENEFSPSRRARREPNGSVTFGSRCLLGTGA
ncbi:hypothetical protein F2P81_015860 [Scophthalmus maximus]|uniref:Uncharacterized protein n=1 Tax=Scophthalmus maximus TaxID=52904 RepID=A0A6A4SFF6_SCOMX|nr:hypothetical protein F2P81_015860 [Scophthalmus maximus]